MLLRTLSCEGVPFIDLSLPDSVTMECVSLSTQCPTEVGERVLMVIDFLLYLCLFVQLEKINEVDLNWATNVSGWYVLVKERTV